MEKVKCYNHNGSCISASGGFKELKLVSIYCIDNTLLTMFDWPVIRLINHEN